MNKTSIKNFAIWARVQLIEAAKQRAFEYDITENGENKPNVEAIGGRLLTADEKKQRSQLISQIRGKGYTQVMEEAAYTWFNRFIALRFMEINGYLPSKIRIFTNEENEFKPEILKEAMTVELDGLKREIVLDFLDNQDNEELYKYLIITQCNALNTCLPVLFERIANWTELLFPAKLLRQDSVIGKMVSMIPQEDWTDQVQIIGWLYQYYNAELKAKADADVKQGEKITGTNLPEKTQVFTPDWIVRYMVENSLGRLWVEGHPNDELKANWKYYLEEAEQEPEVQKQLAEIRKEYAALKPEEIKVIDPCMGSGHILVYMFDVLVQIYEAYGYNTREAAGLILQNNLYGLDIDDRAAQLAYFAVMMKARQYDRRIFSRGIQPHVYAIVESNGISRDVIDYFEDGRADLKKALETIITELHDAKEYGSILNVTQVDFAALYARLEEIKEDISLFTNAAQTELRPIIEVAEAMAQKYQTVVTNPPYLGLRSIGSKTLSYIEANYPDSKNDFFAVFIEKAVKFTKPFGKTALVTAESWLSLSSFEKIRIDILESTTINNMLHLGSGAFDAGFGTVAFSLTNAYIHKFEGVYFKLNEIEAAEDKEFVVAEKNTTYLHHARQNDFSLIPGSAVSYWVSEKLFDSFVNFTALGDIAEPRQGLTTCDNDRFLRFWHEVDAQKICFSCTSSDASKDLPQVWYPYNKGGEPRKSQVRNCV